MAIGQSVYRDSAASRNPNPLLSPVFSHDTAADPGERLRAEIDCEIKKKHEHSVLLMIGYARRIVAKRVVGEYMAATCRFTSRPH